MGLQQVKQQQVGVAAQVYLGTPPPPPQDGHSSRSRLTGQRSLVSVVNNSSLSPGSAGPTLPQRAQNPVDAFRWSDFITSSGHPETLDSFKVVSRVQLQAHPAVPSKGKTWIYIQQDRQPRTQAAQGLEFFSAIPNPSNPFLQSGLFVASRSVVEQGGSGGLSPLLIINRG